MDARFADTDGRRPSGATDGGEAVSAYPADAPSAHADTSSGALVRRMTAEGLQRARDFLAEMRERPSAPREPPPDLLYDDRYSRPFQPDVWIERRSFQTRREAAEYIAPKFEPIRHRVANHAGVWSWLGMYYFADTVRVEDGTVRLSPLDETFVAQHGNGRSHRLRYQHYLWSAWRLYVMYGDSVAFLLDQDITSLTGLADRALRSIRTFNSAGVIPLMLHLYTANNRQKRGYRDYPGGQRHLLRVLDQLERTYDVYGMEPDALLSILPDDFQRWVDQ